MRKLILILLLIIPLVCFSQSRFKKGIKVGTDIWVIDSIFIRNDSLIFQINDTIEFSAPNLSYVNYGIYDFAINDEAWIERRRRYFSN